MTPRGGGSNKPHLLYIAFWFPPSRASGVYRALATVKEFAKAGWDVSVLTVSREFLLDEIGSVDDSLVDEVPEGVDVGRIPFSFWTTTTNDLRSLGWISANFPRIRKWVSTRTALDNYQSWIAPARQTAGEMGALTRFDHVLATGNPYSSFELARLVAADLAIPFSVDFRDPWTIDVFTGTHGGSRAANVAEERIIGSAVRCFHVNAAISQAYRQKYPEYAAKHVVAPNGYDPESLGRTRPPTPLGTLRFGVLGTVTERWPLEATISGWLTVRESVSAEFILAGHLGYFDRSIPTILASLPDGEAGFIYAGPVAKSDVAAFYATLDVVVVPVPGGPMVTSGKIYEALALGIPVVCVQEPGGGARLLLNGHPLAFAAEPNTESVAAALESAARAARNLDPQLSQRVRNDMRYLERGFGIRTMIEAVEAVS